MNTPIVIEEDEEFEKKVENEDYYDYDTDFNPLIIKE